MNTAPQSEPKPVRKHSPRKSLLKRLEAAGIRPTSVVRNRRTGRYTIKFVGPNNDNFYSRGTAPAQEWAERIQEALPLADIVEAYDSVADWRPARTVLFATVVLNLPEKQSARRTEVQQAP